MERDLTGKTIVVTGATSGIGRATAHELLRQGAGLIGIGRSRERCRETEQALRSLFPGADVHYLIGDLALQSKVRRVGDQIGGLLAQQNKPGLDGLINNAGTFTYWLALTAEGFETQWAVNHLAPFLLTHQLRPLLQAAPEARVITVSSDSHYGLRLNWNDLQLIRRYNGLRAYGQSKLANILFTLELNRLLGPDSTVRAFAADPGLVRTEIGFKGTPALVRWVWDLRRSAGVSPLESAQGIVALLHQPIREQAREIYWKFGQPKQASVHAHDLDAARRLWVVSEQMCAINVEECDAF